MCMKYVNAIVRAYSYIQEKNGEVIAFMKPFDHAEVPMNKENRRVSPAFKVAVNINILGSMDKENKENPIVGEKKLIFRLNMTQFNSEKEQRMTKVLDLFEIDLSKAETKAELYTACYEFLNTTRIVSVPSLTLPEGSGRYALKLFIAEKTTEIEERIAKEGWEFLRYSNEYFTIQCMSEIDFKAMERPSDWSVDLGEK